MVKITGITKTKHIDRGTGYGGALIRGHDQPVARHPRRPRFTQLRFGPWLGERRLEFLSRFVENQNQHKSKQRPVSAGILLNSDFSVTFAHGTKYRLGQQHAYHYNDYRGAKQRHEG
jgi:hypothetical protein